MPLGIRRRDLLGGRQTYVLGEVCPGPVPTGILPDLPVDQPLLYMRCAGRAI
jgi:hypothetical protein